MATQLSLCFMLAASLFMTGQGQLFDRSEIEDGGSFILTCDASHIGNVPAAVTAVYALSIERAMVSGTGATLIAVYSPGLYKNLTKNIPDGRPWVIEASGGRSSVDPDNNRASIKLTLYVTDAQCADAGLYSCEANFAPTGGGVSSTSRSQNLTLEAKTDVPVITSDFHNGNDPYYSSNPLGQDITLTCSVLGPKSLVLKWQYRSSVNFNLMDSTSYTVSDPLLVPGSTCNQYRLESILSFRVNSEETMYVCAVLDGNNKVTETNFTLQMAELFERSDSVIEDGGIFTFVCEASQLDDVPANVTTLHSLSIERQVGTETQEKIVGAYLHDLSKNTTMIRSFIPPGRQWVIRGTGGEGPKAANSRANSKLALHVLDAQCADAGIYKCIATFSAISGISKAERSENIPSRGKAGVPQMTWNRLTSSDPFYAQYPDNQHALITCTVMGPQTLTVKIQLVSTEMVNPDAVMMKPMRLICSSCNQYRHKALLNVTKPNIDDTYDCVVEHNQMEIANTKFTISMQKFLEQQYVIDRADFKDGGAFTVTCDASRLAHIPSNVTYISQLSIERIVGAATQGAVVASYVPFPHPGFLNLTTNIPSERNWGVQATGGIGSDGTKDNNKATIQLSLVVADAVCADVGTYRCVASYYSKATGPGNANRSEYITYQAEVEKHTITSSHHNGDVPDYSRNDVGENITLKCSVLGYHSLQISWMFGPKDGESCSAFQNANSSDASAALQTGACLQYRHESTLTFTVQSNETTYVCVVSDDEVEVSRKNFTIVGLSARNRSTGVSWGNAESRWFGRNMILQALAIFMWFKSC